MPAEPSAWKAWILAARPRTLPAAAAPVLAASALAWYDGVLRPLPALAALAGALLLQIGANLANDFMDHERGTDNPLRLGPTRVTAAGLLPARTVKIGTAIVFALAALCGLYLALEAGWVVVAIGVAAIAAALAYTGGPYPLGYNGLGEVFVFLFFGLAAVMGTYYVQARTVTWNAFWLSLPLGLLIVAILVVNNLRDLEGDRSAGKRTQAVRHGAAWTKKEYTACLWGAFLSIPIAVVGGWFPWTVFAVLGAVPLAMRLVRAVHQDTGRKLNQTLAGTGNLTLIFAALAGLGFVISGLLRP